ncbi:hypothetical protein WN48_06769 [Eufriesea mexicana]|uniref:Uncharacterized protein n=1 Tax=Eufriesea mexicana TaxID=516756 RepID=A0A310SSG1_9HYME|nr:hypothetical protein WN48_06769 [Eufriesea mexicana]
MFSTNTTRRASTSYESEKEEIYSPAIGQETRNVISWMVPRLGITPANEARIQKAIDEAEHEESSRRRRVEEARKRFGGWLVVSPDEGEPVSKRRTADRLIERRVAADRLNDGDDGEPYESIANSRVPARRERNGRWYGVLLPRATTTTTTIPAAATTTGGTTTSHTGVVVGSCCCTTTTTTTTTATTTTTVAAALRILCPTRLGQIEDTKLVPIEGSDRGSFDYNRRVQRYAAVFGYERHVRVEGREDEAGREAEERALDEDGGRGKSLNDIPSGPSSATQRYNFINETISSSEICRPRISTMKPFKAYFLVGQRGEVINTEIYRKLFNRGNDSEEQRKTDTPPSFYDTRYNSYTHYVSIVVNRYRNPASDNRLENEQTSGEKSGKLRAIGQLTESRWCH